jgi:hypothetical protein
VGRRDLLQRESHSLADLADGVNDRGAEIDVARWMRHVVTCKRSAPAKHRGIPKVITILLPSGVTAGIPPAHARTRTRRSAGVRSTSSATIRAMSEHPRCAAMLQGGKQCRSVAVTGSEFCQHHAEIAAEHGAEPVKGGEHLPAPRKRVVQPAVVAEETVRTTGNGSITVDPASVRPRPWQPISGRRLRAVELADHARGALIGPLDRTLQVRDARLRHGQSAPREGWRRCG